jgi:hypothetical protein
VGFTGRDAENSVRQQAASGWKRPTELIASIVAGGIKWK